jgi:hypothetical protein
VTSIGFTGTREGMTIAQWEAVDSVLDRFFEVPVVNEWHVGDCIGADQQACGLIYSLQAKYRIKTHGHIPNHNQFRAFCDYDVEHEPKQYLARNRDIVDASDLMIAAPYEYEEVGRGSGTWATIRYADRVDKPLIMVWPDGKMDEENGAGS